VPCTLVLRDRDVSLLAGFLGSRSFEKGNCQPIFLSLFFGVVIAKVAGFGGQVLENGTWVPGSHYLPRILVVVAWNAAPTSGDLGIQTELHLGE
jgi:hypothetical protein